MIDAHVHLWDATLFSYPWLRSVPVLDSVRLPAQLAAGSPDYGAIFVQADCLAEQSVAEARWVSQLGWTLLRGIVAGADLRSSSLRTHLDALATVPGVVGVRHLLQGEDASGWASDNALVDGLRLLADRGLTFDACVHRGQLEPLVDLLDLATGLDVVLDHLGNPPLEEGLESSAGHLWRDNMRRLSQRSRTFVKLSGLAPLTNDRMIYETNTDAFLREALESFGADRAMIGSDWPVSAQLGSAISPAEWRYHVLQVAASVGADLDALDAGTAEQFYGVAPVA